jgi:glycerol-3-phosphate dehydrogenase
MQHELAVTVEDILARRTRLLFLDARAAMECAPRVANWMAEESGQGEQWQQDQIRNFDLVAKNYIIS